ncbi:MAG: LLM class flavin-dependent oxidoreductase [Pseudomonadota bacterium]
MRLGVLLNFGEMLGDTAEVVFAFSLEQARLAAELGYRELWLTEHHFIPFGINPSALTSSAFLLGRFPTLHVGTAVTLAPLQNPIELAERAALLDQWSGGRLMLGLGRGGYLKDYEVLDAEPERWSSEPVFCAERLAEAFSGADLAEADHQTGVSRLRPPPHSDGGPPLYFATSSDSALCYAAQSGIPLLHHFAAPEDARAALETRYAAHLHDPSARVAHVHMLTVVVSDDVDSDRERLTDALTCAFEDGDWPHLPDLPKRHVDAAGHPLSRRDRAAAAAARAVMGDAETVRTALLDYAARTGAQRLVVNAEVIDDREQALATLAALAPLTHANEGIAAGPGSGGVHASESNVPMS